MFNRAEIAGSPGGYRRTASRETRAGGDAAGYMGPCSTPRGADPRIAKPISYAGISSQSTSTCRPTPLLPELAAPVARLRDFGGGFVPPAVAVEIEFRRQQLGLSLRQLAARIGRSQGQLANALRGHDPISAASANRLREFLLGSN